MKAIGIDPGLAMTGFGIVETLPRGGRACDWGAIRTESDCPISLRLKIIYDGIKGLIEKWEPGLLAMEEVFVLKQFPKAAIQLGEVRGVIFLAAQEKDIPLVEVRPTEVKSALTGSGRADKKQMERAIRQYLKIEGSLGSSHAGDALALALTGLSRTSKFRW
ncbi:MAG: crossover junction endodeoxyribonuclease RuvC [Deltaproteobacteria bacterium]|nr:crossover junction endodeoxyribonuclease RuvC [Deltaproteobacteria bacterium]MBM4323354.1 crossover junction endodeoxyribonuclease RuvC [Deltaproteobacteria bacterium]